MTKNRTAILYGDYMIKGQDADDKGCPSFCFVLMTKQDVTPLIVHLLSGVKLHGIKRYVPQGEFCRFPSSTNWAWF